MVNLGNMPVSREHVEKYQNRHLRQVEHAAKQHEGREMKVKNNNLRKEWLERQNNLNYRNEYDRLRGELTHRKIPWKTMHQLEQRQNELHKLLSSGNV